MALPPTAVSAPGKVLLTGGYLVLDRAYTGLVFALDARIYVHIQALSTGDGITLQEIVAKSPQFRHARWSYGFRSTANHGGVQVTALTARSVPDNQRNIFIESALAYTLSYICATTECLSIDPSSITILADNDYYSSMSDSSLDSSHPSPQKFKVFGVSIDEAHKTGLGSSAALVTALVGALLSHYLPRANLDLSTVAGKRRLHNLAQAAHSAAQGKIGSGFDVASAVFGSCQYRRFSPFFLEQCGSIGAANFAKSLKSVVDDALHDRKWDTEILESHLGMPKGLRLVMCDVDCGSKTPGMVKKLLHWRATNSNDANRIWDNLQLRNNLLSDRLRTFRKDEASGYQKLRDDILQIRALLREMSQLSGVPVEPEPQTKLLDACTALSGVIGGVTPGAGGFDAVVLLIEDDEQVIVRLKDMLSTWKFEVDAEAGGGSGKVRLLDVREDQEGLRIENPSDYELWTKRT